MEDINALDLLKEEMETEEIHLKVNVIHRTKTVILSIGVEDTIKKLIPYFESNSPLLIFSFDRERRRRSPICHCRRAGKSLVRITVTYVLNRELLPDKT